MGKCMSLKNVNSSPTKTLAEHTFSIDIRKNYIIEDFCGSGHYGAVHKAVSTSDPSQTFAIKKISKNFIRNSDSLRREVEILSSLHHPNIVKVYETYKDDHFFYIVMQYCSGGTLFSRLSFHKITEKEAAHLFKQILEAVFYLQSKGICHRDIKPENFLFSSKKKNAKLVLIDFGLSHKLGKWFKGMSDTVGTVHYMAPEVINGSYTEKCDNWSAGVILYFLLSGSLPFKGSTEQQIIHSIFHYKVEFDSENWKQISNEAKDLVIRLLCKDPEERICIEEACKHVWFELQHEENQLNLVANFEKYAQKEELLMKINNYLINRFSYKEIEALEKNLQTMGKENLTVEEFEETVGIKIDVERKGFVVNAKKVLKGALYAKLHLNEEKLWRAFCGFDFFMEDRIALHELLKLAATVEGKNRQDFSGLNQCSTYRFEDVLRLYDYGKNVNEYKD